MKSSQSSPVNDKQQEEQFGKQSQGQSSYISSLNQNQNVRNKQSKSANLDQSTFNQAHKQNKEEKIEQNKENKEISSSYIQTIVKIGQFISLQITNQHFFINYADPLYGKDFEVPQPKVNLQRKAVLIGINYYGHEKHDELLGCIKDTRMMKKFLLKKYKLQKENIKILTDELHNRRTDKWPTRDNILKAIRWLMDDVKSGDSLIFQFSGHGFQCNDILQEEDDGKKEFFYPIDKRQANGSFNEIYDYEFNKYLCNPLPKDARLHCIFDACHSGTAVDLPFTAVIQDNMKSKWKNNYVKLTSEEKGTDGGFAVQIAACTDAQYARCEARFGIASYYFISTMIKYKLDITYEQLILNMRKGIKDQKNKQQQIHNTIDNISCDCDKTYGSISDIEFRTKLSNSRDTKQYQNNIKDIISQEFGSDTDIFQDTSTDVFEDESESISEQKPCISCNVRFDLATEKVCI